VQPARALPSPRMHLRNRRPVRRRTSGRSHYNGFRDYDPATGRYIESDPIGLYGGINTYIYAGAIGNLIGQLSDQCHPFSLTSLLVATGGGFVAGAVLPYVPGGLVGAGIWGGVSNFGQYWAGSAIQGQGCVRRCVRRRWWGCGRCPWRLRGSCLSVGVRWNCRKSCRGGCK